MSYYRSRSTTTFLGIIGEAILFVLLFVLGVAIAAAFWGAVIYALYNWVFLGLLAGPVFGLSGLPTLTFLQCGGLGLILGFFSNLLRVGSGSKS